VSCSIRDAAKRHFRERASAVLRAIAARASRRRRANQAGVNHYRVCRPEPIMRRGPLSRGVPLSASSGTHRLAGRLAVPISRGHPAALLGFWVPRRFAPAAGGLTFPPRRAHVPFATATSPDLFSSGRSTGDVECLRRPRGGWRVVRLLGLAPVCGPRRTAVAMRPILPRTFPLAGFRARALRANGRNRRSSVPSESSVPGHRFRRLSAHGFPAPFQRRRIGDMHRLVHLPAACCDGRRRPFSVL